MAIPGAGEAIERRPPLKDDRRPKRARFEPPDERAVDEESTIDEESPTDGEHSTDEYSPPDVESPPDEGSPTVEKSAAVEELPINEDITLMLNDLSQEERLGILAAEVKRNPEILKVLRQYFDIVNNNGTVVSVEKFTKIIRIESPPRYQGLDMSKWRQKWETAIEQVLSKINHRSHYGTRQNAITALRTIGRAGVREGVYLREDEITRTMRTITNRMTHDERKKLILHYGSLKLISNFELDLPNDHNPPWLQRVRPARMRSPCKEVLDDAGFLSGSDTEQTKNGVVDASETGSVENKEM